jgi:hypothetical protein
LYLLALILFPQSCEGRCGESLDEAIQRFGPVVREYGDPAGVADSVKVFKIGTFVINAFFKNKVIVGESYSKIDGTALSDQERSSLLQAESGKQTWSVYRGWDVEQAWSRPDGTVAVYSRKVMVFLTREYIELGVEKKESKDAIFHF